MTILVAENLARYRPRWETLLRQAAQAEQQRKTPAGKARAAELAAAIEEIVQAQRALLTQ